MPTHFRRYAFTYCVIIAATAALVFPTLFVSIGSFQLKQLIIPLLQLIMFGMGTTIGAKDFAQVLKAPRKVMIGLVCQLTIMPLIGYGIASVFGFTPEVAAGIILVGCSPSGLASNVMAYLAKANVPLSVTITTLATLLAPLSTPLLMSKLGSAYINVDAVAMLWDIVKMVILPVVSGLLINTFFPTVVSRLGKFLPVISMAAIAIIIVVIIAAGRDTFLTVGALLLLAVFLHNVLGYALGFYAAKLCRLNEADCRTIAIEVGMQNAGLASGLAMQMGKAATVGLVAGVFGIVMNMSGSILSSWWGSKKP